MLKTIDLTENFKIFSYQISKNKELQKKTDKKKGGQRTKINKNGGVRNGEGQVPF